MTGIIASIGSSHSAERDHTVPGISVWMSQFNETPYGASSLNTQSCPRRSPKRDTWGSNHRLAKRIVFAGRIDRDESPTRSYARISVAT